MAYLHDEIQKKAFENLKEDLCGTYEGAAFMERYLAGRNAISDLEDKVISVIKDSNLSAAEAVGFMQYMKYAIMRRAFVPQPKERE